MTFGAHRWSLGERTAPGTVGAGLWEALSTDRGGCSPSRTQELAPAALGAPRAARAPACARWEGDGTRAVSSQMLSKAQGAPLAQLPISKALGKKREGCLQEWPGGKLACVAVDWMS